MKICTQCGDSKESSEFYSRGKNRKDSNTFCKPCFNAYCIQRWKDRKKQAVGYKGGKCKDCSITYHPNVYDFHHTGDKEANWNKIRLWSWDRITKELDKCVLLCANCHRIRHIT